ncbi:MAG TPA: gamma-glutamyltransferase [Luteimonas sp.]|nr:gamma-glutamyltransferase [Luteimonas sp.]
MRIEGLTRRLRIASVLVAVLATFAGLSPAVAQTRQLLNYEAIHKPVHADRGMVVSQNAVASEIGAQVLRDGGNAVDAAVATAFAMAVVLPRAGNIGGDGFMLVYLAGEERTIAIDYRSMAPAAATLDRYLDKDGKVVGDSAGYTAAGVPGTVAGLALAHRKYGRLPWARLLQPAIRLAADGLVLSRDEAYALDWGRQRLARSEAGAKVFLHPDGSALRAGERLVQADLAWSLQQIADHGADAFYRGAIAERLAAGMARHGGLIARDDLAAYRAIERDALLGSYRGHGIATMPPVSGGGASVIEMLNILETRDLTKAGAGSADALHAMAEAIKLAWADRSRYAGDPGFSDIPVGGLTSKQYAAQRAQLMSPDKTLPAPQLAPGDPWQYESKETTQISVIDADGNAVSNTYTLGSDFGSGVMVEGTGFLLGNLIGNFPTSAQARAGKDAAKTMSNLLGPGRRPVSSMSPTMLFKDGELWMVTGSPGGNTIPGTVMQTIVDVVDFGMNIAEATSMPRIHQEMRSGELRVERGFSPDTLRLLQARGHEVSQDETIGSTQTLMRTTDGVEGAADPRRPGAAAVAQ